MDNIAFGLLYIIGTFSVYGVAIWLIVRSVKKNKMKKENEEREKRIRMQELEKAQKEAKEREIIENARKKHEEEQRQFEIQQQERASMLEKRAKKYINNVVTLEIANDLADFFILTINQFDRKTTEPNINIKFYIVRDGQVIHADNEKRSGMHEFAKFKYSLIEHHLREIQDNVEFHSFLFALTQKTAEIINGKLLKDPSGTSYNLKITENIFTSHDGHCIYDGYGYHLSYTAKNGYYITPKDW